MLIMAASRSIRSAIAAAAGNRSNDPADNAVFACGRQGAGTFKVLPSNFQQSPGSVLVQLQMRRPKSSASPKSSPTVRSARRGDRLGHDGRDGDMVEINAAGFSQAWTIMHKPYLLCAQSGGSVNIKAVHDAAAA